MFSHDNSFAPSFTSEYTAENRQEAKLKFLLKTLQ